MPRQGNDLNLGLSTKGKPIILSHDLRLHHAAIMGLTGTGKSRYVEYLIRQDLKAWPRTNCGMLVIDPHGELFDGIMAWVAANKLQHLPIIPIDFRQQNQVVSYNILRQRAVTPSVMIDNFVRAMAYVWGAAGTDETPLFERWGINTLHRLYAEKKTLSDAAHLFTDEGLVRMSDISDPMIRRDWAWARRNRKDFEVATSSTINRFRRFLLNPTFRAVFGQSDVSLDFGQALEKGHIVLVSLARDGGHISRENADLFATLLLADLWNAADERGKHDRVKPFYTFIDEFPRFLTPTMAENLAEARGFGIGIHAACQFPRQILNGGEYGARIFDEIMENARTKIIFRLRSRANLEPVAESLFMSTFDPYRIKYQHYSTKVLGHSVSYMPSYGHTTTRTEGGGNQESRSRARSHAVGTNWSHTDSIAHSVTRSSSDSDSESDSIGTQWGESSGSVTSTGRNGGRSSGGSSSTGGGHSQGMSGSQTTSEGFGISGRDLPSDGSPSFQAHFDADGTVQTWNVGSATTAGVNEASSSNWNQGSNWSDASGWSEAASTNEGTSRGGSRTRSVASSHTEGVAATESVSASDSYGGSETFGTSEGETVGKSEMWAKALGQSVTTSPMLFPVMGKEAEQPLYLSVEEQKIIAMVKIARLKDREAYILAGDMEVPELIRTPDVHRPEISNVCRKLSVERFQRESGIALPLSVAIQRVLDRDKNQSGLAAADMDFALPNTRTLVVAKRRQGPESEEK